MSASPIELFLGQDALDRGPFGLLGLSVELHDDTDIVAALRSRVAQVEAHAQARTPAADEVRLALHAAAAQLLDPGIQRRLAERWSQAPQRDTRSPAEPMDPMLAMSLVGGWTPQSLRRLAMVANAQGLAVSDMVQAISQHAGYGAGAIMAPASEQAAPDADAEAGHDLPGIEREPPVLPLWVIFAIGIVAVVGLVTALIVLTPEPLRVSTPQVTTPPPSAAQSPTPAASPPVQQPVPQPAAVDFSKAGHDVLLGRLDAAVGAVGFDASSAVSDAGPVIAALAARWTQLPPDVLVRANGLLLELVYGTAPWPDSNLRLVQAIAEPARSLAVGIDTADQVMPAIWSAGFLGRLAGEADLPSRSVAAIDVALRDATGATGRSAGGFAGATRLMVGRMPAALASAEPLAWQAWIEAVASVTDGDGETRDRVLLSGLEVLVRPQAAGGTGQPARSDAIDRVVGAVDWSQSGRGRAWLVRSLLAPGIEPPGLHSITSSLARRATAGVDLALVLSRNASEYERRELAEQLATLWQLESLTETGELASAWSQKLSDVSLTLRSSATPLEQLASAVRFARLSEAASYRWRGDSGDAIALVASLDADINGILDAPPGGTDSSLEQEDDFGLEFLRAEREPGRQARLLTAIASQRQIGPMSAEVLVGEALRGSTRPTRDAARAAVIALAHNASVVNALLEELPSIRPSRVSAELIESATGTSLPDPDSADWMLVARRHLVERLLQLVASESELRAIDQLSDLLGGSYEARLAGTAASGGSARMAPEAAALLLRSELEQRARALFAPAQLSSGLAEIEADRTTRLSIADGPPQRFLAQQLAAVALFGQIVAAEQPSRAAEVRRELTALDATRQRATHVLEQIAAAERTMARLWAIRLGETLP